MDLEGGVFHGDEGHSCLEVCFQLHQPLYARGEHLRKVWQLCFEHLCYS